MTLLNRAGSSSEEQWISVSDMMAGLMMVFLFVSIFYIENINKRYGAYEDKKEKICSELENEFQKNETEWGMSICKDGVLIKFDRKLNFELGSTEISSKFKSTLDSFFPRLMTVIMKFEDSISELRIEGHTDTNRKQGENKLKAYLSNTELSQNRSRAVLDYSLNLDEIKNNIKLLEWSYSNITAHGLSSSKKIMTNGKENKEASRRVEFRLKLVEEEKLIELTKNVLGVDE